MTDNGKILMTSIRNVLALHKEMQSFIDTLDMLLSKSWTIHRPRGNEVVWSDFTSKTLGDPYEWLPPLYYRAYRNKQDSKHHLLDISIILHERDDEDIMSEPLLVVTNMMSSKKVSNDWISWSWDFYFDNQEVIKMNELYTRKQILCAKTLKHYKEDPSYEMDLKDFEEIEDLKLIATPLVGIKNDADIRELLAKIDIHI